MTSLWLLWKAMGSQSAIQPINETPRNMLEVKTSNKEVEF